MKRKLLTALLVTGACAAGVVCAELLVRLPAFRNATGILFKRGHLLALAQGQGIYEADLRTRLGFHIIQLTDFKPSRQITFGEVQPEIRLAIENEKRRPAL